MFARLLPRRSFSLSSLFAVTFCIALATALLTDLESTVQGLLNLLPASVAVAALADLRSYERIQAKADPVGFRWFYRLARTIPLLASILAAVAPAAFHALLVGVIAGTLPLAPLYQVDRHWLSRARRGTGWAATLVLGGTLIYSYSMLFSMLFVSLIGQRQGWPGPVINPVDQLGVIAGCQRLIAIEGQDELIAWLVAAGSLLAFLACRIDQRWRSRGLLVVFLGALAWVAGVAAESCSQLLVFRRDWPADLPGYLIRSSLWYLLYCGLAAGYLAYRREPAREVAFPGLQGERVPDSQLVRAVLLVAAGLVLLLVVEKSRDSIWPRSWKDNLWFFGAPLVLFFLWCVRNWLGRLLLAVASLHGWRWLIGILALLPLHVAIVNWRWWLETFWPVIGFFMKLAQLCLYEPESAAILVLASAMLLRPDALMTGGSSQPRQAHRVVFDPLAFLFSLLALVLLFPAGILLVWRYQFQAMFAESPWGIPLLP